jgi:hypothetical protein
VTSDCSAIVARGAWTVVVPVVVGGKRDGAMGACGKQEGTCEGNGEDDAEEQKGAGEKAVKGEEDETEEEDEGDENDAAEEQKGAGERAVKGEEDEKEEEEEEGEREEARAVKGEEDKTEEEGAGAGGGEKEEARAGKGEEDEHEEDDEIDAKEENGAGEREDAEQEKGPNGGEEHEDPPPPVAYCISWTSRFSSSSSWWTNALNSASTALGCSMAWSSTSRTDKTCGERGLARSFSTLSNFRSVFFSMSKSVQRPRSSRLARCDVHWPDTNEMAAVAAAASSALDSR